MDINPKTLDTIVDMVGGNARIKSQFRDLLRSNQTDIAKANAIEKLSLYGPFIYSLLTQYAQNCVLMQKQGKSVSSFWDFYENLGGNPERFVEALSPEIFTEFENLGRSLSKAVHTKRATEVEIPLPTPSAPPAEIETPLPTPSAPPAEIVAPRARPVIASPRERIRASASNTTQEPLPPYDIGPPPPYTAGAQSPAYTLPTLPRYDEVVPKRTWREWLLGRRRVEPQNPENTPEITSRNSSRGNRM